MKFDPVKAAETQKLKQEARLSVLYEIRDLILPEIRTLELILDKPLSGRD